MSIGDDFNEEIWAPVPSFPGYEASSLGRVRSMPREIVYVDGRRYKYAGQVLRIGKDNGRGYPYVGVGKRRTRPVHTLVLEAFRGPRPAGMEGCHNDGDRSNARLSNLRWDTPSSNQADRIRHGTNHQVNRTSCPLGHDLLLPNLVPRMLRKSSARICLACDRARRLRKQRRRRGTPGETDIRKTADRYYKKIMKDESMMDDETGHDLRCPELTKPLANPDLTRCLCREPDGHTRRDDDGSRRVWSEKTLINLDQVPPCEEAS